MKTTGQTTKSILAIIPILLFGISWIFEILKANATITLIFFLSSFASMYILFGIGWVKDFPKWTILSVGFCILISILSMNISIPQLTGGRLLGLYAFLPMLITLLISLLLHFSWRPVKEILKKISEEKNTVIFIFYGFLPMWFIILFDEMYQISVIPFAVILTLLTSACVLIYLESRKKIIRTISLISGMIITNVISVIALIYL
jgi:hypothetical protein